jgi:hypothetical protein
MIQAKTIRRIFFNPAIGTDFQRIKSPAAIDFMQLSRIDFIRVSISIW